MQGKARLSPKADCLAYFNRPLLTIQLRQVEKLCEELLCRRGRVHDDTFDLIWEGGLQDTGGQIAHRRREGEL